MRQRRPDCRHGQLGVKKGYAVVHPDAIGHLTELSRYVYELVNMNFPTRQPFVAAELATRWNPR